jgi:hypothetical protein
MMTQKINFPFHTFLNYPVDFGGQLQYQHIQPEDEQWVKLLRLHFVQALQNTNYEDRYGDDLLTRLLQGMPEPYLNPLKTTHYLPLLRTFLLLEPLSLIEDKTSRYDLHNRNKIHRPWIQQWLDFNPTYNLAPLLTPLGFTNDNHEYYRHEIFCGQAMAPNPTLKYLLERLNPTDKNLNHLFKINGITPIVSIQNQNNPLNHLFFCQYLAEHHPNQFARIFELRTTTWAQSRLSLPTPTSTLEDTPIAPLLACATPTHWKNFSTQLSTFESLISKEKLNLLTQKILTSQFETPHQIKHKTL